MFEYIDYLAIYYGPPPGPKGRGVTDMQRGVQQYFFLSFDFKYFAATSIRDDTIVSSVTIVTNMY